MKEIYGISSTWNAHIMPGWYIASSLSPCLSYVDLCLTIRSFRFWTTDGSTTVMMTFGIICACIGFEDGCPSISLTVLGMNVQSAENDNVVWKTTYVLSQNHPSSKTKNPYYWMLRQLNEKLHHLQKLNLFCLYFMHFVTFKKFRQPWNDISYMLNQFCFLFFFFSAEILKHIYAFPLFHLFLSLRMHYTNIVLWNVNCIVPFLQVACELS